MKLLLMCDAYVGASIANWLLDNYFDDISVVVTMDRNHIFERASTAGIPSFVYKSTDQLLQDIRSQEKCTLGLLAWWPKIIPHELLELTDQGFINTHPSLLPFNRGKHYNFWALVEQCPFGVTIHKVDNGIDSGDIITQQNIPYGWQDTGGTLYDKAINAMFELFRLSYPLIRDGKAPSIKQDLSKGSFHHSREINDASQIHLDKQYLARDLINLLRARVFPGYSACWFEENGSTYEITLSIKRK